MNVFQKYYIKCIAMAFVYLLFFNDCERKDVSNKNLVIEKELDTLGLAHTLLHINDYFSRPDPKFDVKSFDSAYAFVANNYWGPNYYCCAYKENGIYKTIWNESNSNIIFRSQEYVVGFINPMDWHLFVKKIFNNVYSLPFNLDTLLITSGPSTYLFYVKEGENKRANVWHSAITNSRIDDISSIIRDLMKITHNIERRDWDIVKEMETKDSVFYILSPNNVDNISIKKTYFEYNDKILKDSWIEVSKKDLNFREKIKFHEVSFNGAHRINRKYNLEN